jgi:hypothetical protein
MDPPSNVAYWMSEKGSTPLRGMLLVLLVIRESKSRTGLEHQWETTWLLIDWLIHSFIHSLWWGETVSELRPPTGLVFIPRVICEHRAMVVMMPAGDNAWLVHESFMAVLPAETSRASRRNGRRSENFAYQYLKYLKGSLTFRKILRHGTSGFTSHTKEGVLRIFNALKNPLPRPGLNLRPLGPVANTLTATPPRRQLSYTPAEIND